MQGDNQAVGGEGQKIHGEDHAALSEKQMTQNTDAVTQNSSDSAADNNVADNGMTDQNVAVLAQKEQMTVPAHDVDNAEQPDQEVSNEQPDVKPEHNRKTEKEIARESVTPEKPVRTNVPESVKKKVRQKLKGENLHAGVYRQIYGCMLQAQDKQTLNMALVKTFKQENGNHFYKLIQPVFTEWLKTL